MFVYFQKEKSYKRANWSFLWIKQLSCSNVQNQNIVLKHRIKKCIDHHIVFTLTRWASKQKLFSLFSYCSYAVHNLIQFLDGGMVATRNRAGQAVQWAGVTQKIREPEPLHIVRSKKIARKTGNASKAALSSNGMKIESFRIGYKFKCESISFYRQEFTHFIWIEWCHWIISQINVSNIIKKTSFVVF